MQVKHLIALLRMCNPDAHIEDGNTEPINTVAMGLTEQGSPVVTLYHDENKSPDGAFLVHSE